MILHDGTIFPFRDRAHIILTAYTLSSLNLNHVCEKKKDTVLQIKATVKCT